MTVTDEMVAAAMNAHYLWKKRPNDASDWSGLDIAEMRAAIEAALAAAPQPQGEPVAWRWNERGHWFAWTTDWSHHQRAESMGMPIEYAYAYAAPPAPAPQPSADLNLSCTSVQARLAAQWGYAPAAQPSAEPSELVPWQGGLTNDELLAAWQSKLPGVTPTDRELSAFALGIEFSTAQGAHRNGKPAQADQGVSGAFAAGDRRDERDQDQGRGVGRTGREAAGARGAGSAVDQHRGDRLAARPYGADAGRGAADVLLTDEAGSRPPHSDALVRAARGAVEAMIDGLSPVEDGRHARRERPTPSARSTWRTSDADR